MDLSRSTVAVTGATGFIGRYLVSALLDRGAHVVAVVRNPGKVPEMAARGVEMRRADLADVDALAEGFAGADAVLSNAAVVSPLGKTPRAELIDVNVGGTRNVFRALVRAGVGRVVQTSSGTVYRPKRGHFYREEDPLRSASDRPRPLDGYAVSKAESEREAWRLADEHGLELTTFRPWVVYGAFDRNSFSMWFRRLMSPPVSVFPKGVMLPAAYAGDLAEAACRMLERPVSIGKAYNLATPPGECSFWGMYEAYKAAGGDVPRLVVPVPFPIERRYSIDRAVRDLDYENRPLVEGFRDTLAIERAARS